MTLLHEPATRSSRVKRWTKAEYHKLVDRGGFEGQRVYLYRGELIEMPAMGALHVFGVANINDWLSDTFRPEYRVRIQSPLELPDDSVLEPDGAVVTRQQMSRRPHPDRAVLIVEVSDSSLDLDHEMAFDYAASLTPEYWILNMRDRQLEVYRDPIPDPAAPAGHRYASHRVYGEAESVASLARPDTPVAVATLVATTG